MLLCMCTYISLIVYKLTITVDQTFIPIKLHKSASRMMQDILVCKIAKQKPLCTTFGTVTLVMWLHYAVVNLGKSYQAMLLIGVI